MLAFYTISVLVLVHIYGKDINLAQIICMVSVLGINSKLHIVLLIAYLRPQIQPFIS